MIRKIAVKNFRSLKDVVIDFEEDITVLVGENDSGKTSVVEVLKILFDNKSVEIDDFSYGKDEIYIEVDTINENFIKKFWKNDEDNIEYEINSKLNKKYVDNIKNYLNSAEFDSLTDDGKRKKLEEIARRLGVSFRSNIRSDTLKERVLERIETLLKQNYEEILVESNIHDYNVYFLDGKHFEDISKFFQEIFFKDKKKSIWSEEIGDGKTIEEIIKERLEEYSEGIKSEIEKEE